MTGPKWRLLLLATILFLWLAPLPVSADGGGTRTIVGQDYTLEEGERLEEDLLVWGGGVRLLEDGVGEGKGVNMGGDTVIAGAIRGDVVTIGGTVELTSTALIEGDLVVFGRIRRHPDARVHGNTIEGLEATRRFLYVPNTLNGFPLSRPAKPAAPRPEELAPLPLLPRLLATIPAVLFLAAMAVVLVPQRLARVTEAMSQTWLLCCGMGVLTTVVVLILMPVLIIICLGIPVAIVLGFGLLLSALLGLSAAGKLLGERLLQTLGQKHQPPLTATLLGTLVITLIAVIPCIGPVLIALVAAWGIGGVVLTRFGSQPHGPWAPAAHRPSSVTPSDGTAAEPPAAPTRPPQDTRRLDQSPPQS